MLKEFKEFAMRGNLLDMAIGIILGVAFGALVNSMVNDIIMPVVGAIIGGYDFSSLFITFRGRRMSFPAWRRPRRPERRR